MRRENTFRIDYSNFPLKPSYEKIHAFCRTVLGLTRDDVKRLQCHRGGSCAFVKVGDLETAQRVVEEHNEKHEVECSGKKYKLRITMEDGSVEVRVHDLPEDVSEEKIVAFLSAYGEVLSIRELMWGERYDFGGVPLGIWSIRMVVKTNIDSWVTIDGEQAYIVYKGQLQSCRYCKEHAHSGISCVQNKKLLVQKSYANVVKKTGPQQQQQQQQQQRKPKPPQPKPAGLKPAAPPMVTPENFPPIVPQAMSQSEQPIGETNTTNQQTAVVLLTPSVKPLRPKETPALSLTPPQSTEVPNTSVASVELFKKPSGMTLRSKYNGNETDESTTSTSSSRQHRKRPPGKKLRRENQDDEMGEDYIS